MFKLNIVNFHLIYVDHLLNVLNIQQKIYVHKEQMVNVYIKIQNANQ